MKIGKITKLKNDKYKIDVDGIVLTTYDDIIIKNKLLYKKEIDNILYQKIIDETKDYDAYYDALKFVTKKIRCKKELINYLNNLNVSKKNRDFIFKKIISLNLVNDEIYAKSYINDKLLLSKDSLNKITKDLINDGIDENVILNIIKDNEYEDDTKLQKLVIKKINSNSKYSNLLLEKKIIGDMTVYGYSKEKVIDIFNVNKKNDYEIALKEYNKLLKKYEKKYSSSQLEYKIKGELYKKGFNYDDIKKQGL